MKWGFIPQGDGKPHYLVVNADESEPGTCKDIPLMMANPHALVEGMIIASYAIRANHAFIYIRGEVVHVHPPASQPRSREAYAAGYLGTDILGSGFDLDITVHAGAGAYICGEETALLDSLEGCRGQPRLQAAVPRRRRPVRLARRWSTTSRRSPACRRSSRSGADWFRVDGHREVARASSSARCPGHVDAPGPVRGAARHHAARAARPGRRRPRGPRAEVLDARRLVDARC